MTIEKFKELLESHKRFTESISSLRNIGFDLEEGSYKDIPAFFYKTFDLTLSISYNIEGVDWINWFIYENDYGNKDWSVFGKDSSKYGAFDKLGNPICYDVESLYNFIQEYENTK